MHQIVSWFLCSEFQRARIMFVSWPSLGVRGSEKNLFPSSLRIYKVQFCDGLNSELLILLLGSN